MDEEDLFSQLSLDSQSRGQALKNIPALNIFQNVEQKREFLKISTQHYESLQKTCSSKYGPPTFNEILQTLCQEIDSELLSSVEFITVSKLVEELRESYRLFLPLVSEAVEEKKSSCSFPDVTDKNTNGGDSPTDRRLPQKKFLLLAKILPGIPDSSSRENLSSFLFLSDGSSKIHCQIKASLCDEMLNLLNKWVLITDANVIFSSSKLPGILEICSKPIPLEVSCLSPRGPISALNVKSASIFLHKREKFEAEEICVSGLVMAVSEVVQIKNNLIFLIELSHNEDDGYSFHILLKDEFVHWQPLLNPGSCYVFSALRVSSLVKGCGANPVKVFVPCLTCKVWAQKYCHLQEQELKDLWSAEFEKDELNLPIEKKFLNLTHYQGCITDTDLANDGIYMLNHQVRLHLFYVSLVHHFSHLRLGCIIQVHNVHLREYAEDPKIQLFCCMKSCIKVLEFSPLNTTPMDHLVDVEQVIRSFGTLWAQEMLFSQSTNVNWLLEVRKWLISNSSLLGLKHRRHVDAIWNSFLQSTLNGKTEMEAKPRRNLLQEFFSSDHKCPVAIERRSEANVEHSFPSPVSPSHLVKEDFPSLRPKQKQQSMTTRTADNNMEEDFWEILVKNIQGTKMLIGYMAVSPVTGRLCLVDHLNRINIICQPWQMDTTSGSLPHKCTANCLLQQRDTKLVFPCPFAHSWCLGRLIIVNKFQMVLEKFIYGSNRENVFKYVRFSLEDIVVLNGTVLPSFHPQLGLNYICKEPTDDGSNVCTCQMFLFTHKYSLMGQNLSTENPAMRFTASGFFLGKAFQLPAKDVIRYVTKFPKAEELHDITLDLENICEIEATLDCNPHYRVVLLFENTSAQWYDLLQNVGSCYMLVVRGNNLGAFSSCHPPSLVKALCNSNSKFPVQMPQNVGLQELSDWHLDTIYKTQRNSLLNLKKIVSTKMSSHNTTAHSVSDIISSSFLGDIVSLLPTRILSRTYHENMYGSRNTQFSDATMNRYNRELELSTLAGKSIKLVLQDIKSDEELVLFMNLENTSYPLGLLEGAIVEFHLLQRIVSKKNKVYCKFSAISSVCVSAATHSNFPDTDSRFYSHFPEDQKSAAASDLMSSRKNGQDECGSLSLMLSGFYPGRRSHLWTQPFVSQIKKLTVKTICTKCSCLSYHQKCSDKTCNNTQFRVSIYMCLILDDGTSTACANTWQEGLLLQILGLSMIQWNDLVDRIHSKWGEISLESKGNCAPPDIMNEESSLHHFLSLLCESPLVKQKWWMKLKQKTLFVASTIDERFPLRDIRFVAGKIKTRCSPFLQVEILDIQKDSPFNILSI